MRIRFICIHGHFYQPPRENPWLEAVETQDSASPYHDWNERVTAECYGPNASSRILDARDRFAGHGSAIAQAYNHMILPLANERDKRTQVRWGIVDFERRFGRKPEGMWLPETAVDVDSLEALAEEGIPFTILEPHQAARWRRIGEDDWTEHSGAIDPTLPYRCTLPSGRSISIFFYDGPISRRVTLDP